MAGAEQMGGARARGILPVSIENWGKTTVRIARIPERLSINKPPEVTPGLLRASEHLPRDQGSDVLLHPASGAIRTKDIGAGGVVFSLKPTTF